MEKQIDITLSKKYSDREIIKRTFKEINPYLREFVGGVLLVLLNVFLNILAPRIIGDFYTALETENIHQDAMTGILLLCGYYLVIVVANMILTYFSTIIINRAGQQVIFSLRQKVFEKIESFSHEQLSDIPVGRLVTRVCNDTNSLNELYTMVIVNLLKYLLTLFGIAINMILINPILSLFIGGFVIVVLIFTFIYRHFSKIAFSEERKQVSNLNSFLSENLSGMKTIQIFNQEENKKKEFNVTNKALVRAKKMVMFVFAFYRPALSFLYFCAIGVVFLVGFKQVQNGASFYGTVFNFGLLMSFYTYTERFFGPIMHISEQYDKLQRGLVASERIFNILDMESTVKNNGKIVLEKIEGKIEFENVWFAYEKDDWILKDVSFTILPHQTVAFVGSTGSGKTTILSLIVRNYDIQKGKIKIDGIDIQDIELSSLRKLIGQMLQDVFMFSGTIKENITLQDENITDEEVLKTINYVNADKFINKLDKGLDTIVSEKGINFSSGQRQLISFARTLVSKPQLLILDEATANIDTETEVLIQDSLEKMKSIGTMIVVAHRLSTIQNADNIICLSHGKIVEQGTHQELLNNKSYYYKLYRLQFDE